MSRLGGELGDGVFAHPACTAKYIREAMLPQIAKGAHKAGRSIAEVEMIGAPIIVTEKTKTSSPLSGSCSSGASRSTGRRGRTILSSRSTAGATSGASFTRSRWRIAGMTW